MAKIENLDDMSDEGTSVSGGQTFEEYSAVMPDSSRSGFEIATEPVTSDEGFGVMTGESEPTPEKKRMKMSRKMKAAMKKIQDKVCSFPNLYFKNKASIHPEWALDEEEEAIITDSLSFVFDVLNIEFMIEGLDITLTSIWWVIAYPILAIGMIFAVKKSAVEAAHPKEESNAE
jgi:hypothetical protein